MRKMTRSLPIAASALFSVLVLPGAALAQRQLEPVRVTAAATERADSLYARAARHPIQSQRDFRKVARMYEQSAGLRGPEDAKTFAALQMAARLRYAHGDRMRAAANMEDAAALAAARGDVVNAANCYVDAAIVSAELRQRDRAIRFVNAANLLTNSPLITEVQRLELRERLPQRLQVAMIERP